MDVECGCPSRATTLALREHRRPTSGNALQNSAAKEIKKNVLPCKRELLEGA
jgi:hypothetical protein